MLLAPDYEAHWFILYGISYFRFETKEPASFPRHHMTPKALPMSLSYGTASAAATAAFRLQPEIYTPPLPRRRLYMPRESFSELTGILPSRYFSWPRTRRIQPHGPRRRRVPCCWFRVSRARKLPHFSLLPSPAHRATY